MFELRPARDGDAEALTDLVMRSKASWGYDAAFMEASRADLALTPARMAAWTVWIADCAGQMAGMIALSLDGGAEVEEFFVAPEFQGRGLGRALMAELVAACRSAGADTLTVDADPNAEAIYARLGFRTVGRSPSAAIPGRMLPRMVLSLPPAGPSGRDETPPPQHGPGRAKP